MYVDHFVDNRFAHMLIVSYICYPLRVDVKYRFLNRLHTSQSLPNVNSFVLLKLASEFPYWIPNIAADFAHFINPTLMLNVSLVAM